jgi:hypothetical protein
MAHFPKPAAALILALAFLTAGTLSTEANTIYNGSERIRGLYIAADAKNGPVAQDYVMAREMLYLEKDDGTKVVMTQYDFSPMWNVRAYLYDSSFFGGGASIIINGHVDPATFDQAVSNAFEDIRDAETEVASPMSDTGGNSFGPPEVVIIPASDTYDMLLLCNQMGNDFYEGQDSFFKDPNGPDFQLYEAVPSLGNLVAEKSTMELMQYEFDQDIGANLSYIGVSGDQIRISVTGFDRQTKRMKKGFNGWASWMEQSQSIGTSSKPKVTCIVPASSAGALSELVPGSVLMVRASVVSLDANAAVFDCTPV